VLFCAAHVAHGFEDISADFSAWVLFYGRQVVALAIRDRRCAVGRAGRRLAAVIETLLDVRRLFAAL
jgi:hypothetical protein